MSVQNRRLRENVGQLAKEEELLFFKTKWHDTMGEGLTAIRRRLLSSLPEKETDDALRSWSDAVTVIQRDNDDPDQRRDAAGDLFRDAGALNIRLHIRGALPAKKETGQLFILAIRNCLLNAAMHADATELYADITGAGDTDVLSVTNNGRPPEGEIIPRGGLINIMLHAGRIGGRTEIQSRPRFELTVTVPGKEAGIHREYMENLLLHSGRYALLPSVTAADIAVQLLRTASAGLVLMDIVVNGSLDGVEAAA